MVSEKKMINEIVNEDDDDEDDEDNDDGDGRRIIPIGSPTWQMTDNPNNRIVHLLGLPYLNLFQIVCRSGDRQFVPGIEDNHRAFQALPGTAFCCKRIHAGQAHPRC